MHCFPQCTRPIHSAHQKEPRPNTRAARRRTSSVRRQFAARRSCSPEQPPLAASLPAKDVGAQSRTDHAFPDGVFGRNCDLKAPQPFRSCSAGSSLRRRRGATALPRTTHRKRIAKVVSGPSPETPLGSRRVLLRPLSPTTAFDETLLSQASPATRTWPTRPGAGLLLR